MFHVEQSTNQSPMRAFNAAITAPAMQSYLTKVIGKASQDFTASIVAVVGGNAALQACTPISVVKAALRGVAVGLPFEPSLGYFNIIPYGQNAQFQLGYKGLIQLALRSDKFLRINVIDVKAGEMTQDLLTGEIKLSAAADRATLPTIGYCAYFLLKNGFEKSLYMSIEKIKAHALRFSKTAKRNEGVWVSDFEKMAQKTVLKLLLSRYAPLSVDMQNAVRYDQQVFSESNDGEYWDNFNIPTNEECVEIIEEKINQKN